MKFIDRIESNATVTYNEPVEINTIGKNATVTVNGELIVSGNVAEGATIHCNRPATSTTVKMGNFTFSNNGGTTVFATGGTMNVVNDFSGSQRVSSTVSFSGDAQGFILQNNNATASDVTIHGDIGDNVTIIIENAGSLTLDKSTGKNCNLQTNSGKITVRATLGEGSTATSQTGDLQVGTVGKSSTLSTKIGSISATEAKAGASLSSKTGNVNVTGKIDETATLSSATGKVNSVSAQQKSNDSTSNPTKTFVSSSGNQYNVFGNNSSINTHYHSASGTTTFTSSTNNIQQGQQVDDGDVDLIRRMLNNAFRQG